MDDVVRQGKARFVGVSNHPAAEVVELLWAADKHNLAAPAVIQYQYSLLHRWDAEESLVPVADRHGLGLMTYSPLAIGLLTGQVRAGQPIPADSHWFTRPGAAATLAAVEPVIAALVEVAREVQRTPAQVAVAWILANPTVSAAMIGPELPEHIDELIGAVGWQLPLEAKARLDAAASDQGPNELLSAGLHRAQPRKHRR
jgi:aryl-alcohol dehydrogenase-like predicted oxidoreductase